MADEREIIPRLYKKLLALYPRTFREQLGESMEQTFQDLWNEKQKVQQGLLSFVLWMFIDTAIGIFREHLWLISTGDTMQTMFKTLGSSALISFFLLIPFMAMEAVNRRNLNEGFPVALFFGMWFSLFAVCLILLPIVQGRRTGERDRANPVPTQRKTLLTDPRSTLMISIALILFIVILSLLDSWGARERLVNGPDPEQLYVFGIRVPSQFIVLVLFSLPIVAGIIAGRPIVNSLRAGGSLFAHPLHLIIVVVIASLFTAGVIGMIVDQWPCFIGVPNCD